MRIIPVLDVLKGIVVHAKGGEREKYAPVESVLSSSPDPIDIIDAFETSFNFGEVYIADLDAIQVGFPNTSLLRNIKKETEMKIMVDAGIDSVPKAKSILETGVSKIVVGSETLRKLSDLRDILKEVGRDRVIASIDVKKNRVLSKCGKLNKKNPKAVASIFEYMRVRELILLDLDRVGGKLGYNSSLVRGILTEVQVPVIIGGGIGGVKDILELKKLGVSGVLLATALHKGTITELNLDYLLGGEFL